MFDNLRGVVLFRARGQKIYAFIDEVRQNKIGCRKQRFNDDWLYASCYRSNFSEMQEIAEKHGVEIERVKNKGAIFTAFKYKLRFGLFFGILIVFSVIIYFSNVVTQIDVNGCEMLSEDVVLTALADCGIERGKFIPSLDFDSCERKIMLAVNDIAWIGIRSTGSRIVVDVDEMVYAPEMLDENMPCNIVAKHDAQIVEISVLEGVACTGKGYTVHKGDILISGVQEGIKGNVSVKHALGEVIGIYNINVSFSQNLSEEVRVETGEVISRKTLDLMSLQIPLYFSSKSFKDFNLALNESEIYFFDKKIPLTIGKYEYRECENVLKTYDSTQAQALLYEQKLRYEENFLQNTEILSQKVNIDIGESEAVLNVSYTLKGEIGEKNEILFKNSN